MDFNSYLFILCYLPLVVIIYYLLKHIGGIYVAKCWLIVSSLAFLCYSSFHTLVFILVSIVVNYLCAWLFKRYIHINMVFKYIIYLGVFVNIVFLGYYKYAYFIMDNLNEHITMRNPIIVPLGVSFVTFQQIAFLIDVKREEIKELSLIDYIFYITYFPKYVQGPIMKYNDLISQIKDEEKQVQEDNIGSGLWLFVIGLSKKVLLADIFAEAVKWGIDDMTVHMTAMDTIIVALCFTFQIYFDFSGYSNMAIGISKILNINLKDNFDSPYRSKSIMEFWKKWHISLTDFLREYLYFPLGGSKKGKLRTYVNNLLVFLISGLWHGAAWTYIVWGLLHGIAYCLNRLFRKQWEKLNEIFRWMLTFIFVNISWIFFRVPTVSRGIEMIKTIVRMEDTSISNGLIECFRIREITYLMRASESLANFLADYRGIEMWAFLLVAIVISLKVRDRSCEEFRPTIPKCICTIFLFSWSILSLSRVVEFVYGNF